jgi:DNA-binding transcriptional regulator YhcF (GntR family)
MTAIAPTVVYPSLISRACAALDESPVFKDVPDGYLRVILRIVKKINLKRLNSPILASRATLAEESGKSVETVHRVVRWLEERGLVEREQRARPELRGSSSPLMPTKQLLDALLLSEAARASVDEAHPNTGAKASTAKPTSVANKSPARAASPAAAFERVGKVRLPSDLAWLVKEQGMNCSGVLHLMKLAGQAKQRLSTVVAATRKYLEGLEGRELYAYIRALLGKGKDFGYRATEETREAAELEEREYLKQKAQALAGRTFQNRDQRLVVTVDESGILIEMRNGQRAARPFCRSFVEAIEAGRLRGA